VRRPEPRLPRAGGRLAAILFALCLAGCATPEARLRDGLIGAGLAEPLAGCMAERMVDRLSLAQLRRLADIPDSRRAATTEEFLHHARALRDPEILSVTSTSAALCATGLAG
jgi:hypothetical protein